VVSLAAQQFHERLIARLVVARDKNMHRQTPNWVTSLVPVLVLLQCDNHSRTFRGTGGRAYLPWPEAVLPWWDRFRSAGLSVYSASQRVSFQFPQWSSP